MRIAICDDERAAREMLAAAVQDICPQAEIKLYQSGAELLAQEPPEILFLDIQMSGLDGMETARRLRKRDREMILIFVTALEEYVFQAFDVGAFHYLVKPFSRQRLAAVLQKAVRQYEDRRQEILLSDAQQSRERFIMVKKGGVHIKVFIREIVYAEVLNRKITIHKTDGDIEYYGKMAELEKQVGADFYRTHRGYLIHFKYVIRYDSSMVYLERGSAIMSKGKFPEFVREYLKYNQRRGRRE